MSSTTTRLAIAVSIAFGLIGTVGAQQPVRTSAQEEPEEAAQARESIAIPTQPQQDGDPGGPGQGRQGQADGDPGGPGQGRQVLAAPGGALPDLALISSFQLATVAIPWGTSATVQASTASYTKHGHCAFRYKYVTRNQGAGASGATTNRIHRDVQAGPVIASNALPMLAPGATAVSDGHVLLKPGTWMLYVQVDDPQSVVESDEANNLRRVRVTVEGKCKKAG